MKLAAMAFYGLAAGLLAVGLRELLTGFEENRCSMTYMFEYPEYRVSTQLIISEHSKDPHISHQLGIFGVLFKAEAGCVAKWLLIFISANERWFMTARCVLS